LVLSAGIFSHLGVDKVNGISIRELMSHGAATGLLARKIALTEANNDITIADQSMIAAMLKDVGALMLAQHFSAELHDAIARCETSDGLSLAQAELEILGGNHGEIGGYLLGLWGLPCPVVEAVVHHQRPCESIVSDLCPLVAVHAASCLEGESNPLGPGVHMDFDFLTRTGLSERIEDWKAVRAGLTSREDCHA
jgi:HD-like signal output (HDOD) protein